MGHMVTGIYKIYLDGVLVSENQNVVTTSGKRQLLNILAGRSPIPQQIMIGASSTTPESATDTTLEYPLFAEDIVYATPIFDGQFSKIVYKARVDTRGYFEIHEIGLLPSFNISDPLAFSFSSGENITSTGTVEFDETLSRVGGQALKCTGTPTVTVNNPFFGSDVTPQDDLVLAAYTPTGTANVALTAYDSAGNTNTATYTGFTTSWTAKAKNIKTDFSAPGFNWGDVVKIELVPTASVNLDAFTVRSAAMHGEVMSRATYGTPVVRPAAARIDVEYELGIDLT